MGGSVNPYRFIGSSPLVRGGPRADAVGAVPQRLIPARAGRTTWTRSKPVSLMAHPRSCGADLALALEVNNLSGSSPLVRGGRTHGGVFGLEQRLIPARAGRTCRTARP